MTERSVLCGSSLVDVAAQTANLSRQLYSSTGNGAYSRRMSELTEQQMHDLADRLLAAITSVDLDAMRSIYAPNAALWHNFDQRDQSVEENLRSLEDLHRRLSDMCYTEIRRFLAPGGFVQQHVLTGQAAGGPLRMPAMIRFWTEEGRITRLEEYLDTAQAMVMYRG